MEILRNEFALGADKPFELYHFTDVHLVYADERDSDAIRALAEKRKDKYVHAEGVLSEVERLVREEGGLAVNTGDMNDFISCKNHERIRDFSQRTHSLFVCGNHDFRPLGGMQYDVPACREENLSRVQRLYDNDVRFFSRIVNGVNLVGIDDAYYRFEAWQFDRLKQEVARGLPIVLFLHVPLYHEDFYHMMVQGKRKYASLVSTPEEMMTEYPPERYEQQKEDEITHTVSSYILSEPAFRLILCGHVHKCAECMLAGRLPQLVTSIDQIRRITVK